MIKVAVINVSTHMKKKKKVWWRYVVMLTKVAKPIVYHFEYD